MQVGSPLYKSRLLEDCGKSGSSGLLLEKKAPWAEEETLERQREVGCCADRLHPETVGFVTHCSLRPSP